MVRIKIDAYAETICPWCYVGKGFLEQAIERHSAEHPGVEFEVVWRPYYLYVGADMSDVDRRRTYLERLGPDRAGALFDKLTDQAASQGISLVSTNHLLETTLSHRLVYLARLRDEEMAAAAAAAAAKAPSSALLPPRDTFQSKILTEIYRGTLERGADVADVEFLTESAMRVGLVQNESELRDWMTRKDIAAAVEREQTQARELGVTGIPTFTVQGKYRVGGCQEPQVFLQVFEKIQAAERGH